MTSAADGSVVWGAGYRVFGLAVVDPAATVENNLRFPGQYADAETGLYYNFQRYYDSGTGRYTQVDPIGFWADDTNLYRYAFNNPIVFKDPKGLIVPLAIAGALLGGGSNAISNWESLQNGDMTTSEYAKSIIFGMGVGAISAFIPGGVFGSMAAGAVGAATNNAYNQSLTKDCIDSSEVWASAGFGAFGGLLGGVGQKAGRGIMNVGAKYGGLGHKLPPPTNFLNGKLPPVPHFGNVGAVVGSVTGSAAGPLMEN